MPQLRQEWPLVFFTALAPVAVGAGAVLSGAFREHGFSPTVFPASIALFGIIAVAFAISSVHIGRKMRMHRAPRNLLRSWLSREIFLLSGCCGLYLVTAAMYFFRQKYEIEPRFITYAFWAASAVGLLGMVSMQRVYLLRSVRLWTGSRALAMLGSTAFLLGTMTAVLIISASEGKRIEDVLWRVYLIFFGPLFLDTLHVYELDRLKRHTLALVLTLTRLPVYLTVLHFLGRVNAVKLAAVMVAALAGDIIVRLFFFGEQTTSFQTELDRVRRRRLASAGPGGGRP